jgi:hypothetical protein
MLLCDSTDNTRAHWPLNVSVVSQMQPSIQLYGGHGMTLREIRKRGVVAHMACDTKWEKQRGKHELSAPAHTYTHTHKRADPRHHELKQGRARDGGGDSAKRKFQG